MRKRHAKYWPRIGHVSFALAGALGVLAFSSPDPAAARSAKLETAYVVLGGQGAIARAILTATNKCPPIRVGRSTKRMSVRARPNGAFPVLVCETLIPRGTTSAAIGRRDLPLPKRSLARVVTFGDTGCRVEAPEKGKSGNDHYEPGQYQDCNEVSKWPFARVSKAAAARRPDLVIHVGDYLYRESPCPRRDKGCKGTPYGDNWRAWRADFFAPADRLLSAAPWIMVRGNHETCKRGGLGFFRFLHPELARHHRPPACTDFLAPYAMTIGGKPFIVFDSSQADDGCRKGRCDSARYAAQFASLKPARGTWFLSHRPVWGIGRNFTLNQMLQQALKASDGKLPKGIDLALSGHMHIFELLSFADRRAPQLIVGTGGTLLDPKIDRRLEGVTVGGAKISYGLWEHRFGFLMIVPKKKGATATFVNDRGKARFECKLTPSTARCH
jgi:hypothetical protein